MKSLRILGACLGKCIHVAGILKFLRLAETLGCGTDFMGPAVPIERLVSRIHEIKPDLVVVSYRLTPDSARELFSELILNTGIDLYKDNIESPDLKVLSMKPIFLKRFFQARNLKKI